MKNLFKLFGVIAVVAIIGFGMVACKDDGGSNCAGSAQDTAYKALGFGPGDCEYFDTTADDYDASVIRYICDQLCVFNDDGSKKADKCGC